MVCRLSPLLHAFIWQRERDGVERGRQTLRKRGEEERQKRKEREEGERGVHRERQV